MKGSSSSLVSMTKACTQKLHKKKEDFSKKIGDDGWWASSPDVGLSNLFL